MCFAAALPIGLAIGSSLLQASSQMGQANYQASQLNRNALYQDQAAADAEQRGNLQADRLRRDVAGAIGTQRTTSAANGIDVNSGSAADLQDDTAMLGELDALTVANNAAREAYGYRVQASTDRANSKNLRKSAKSSALGTILGGAASAGLAGYNAGLFGGAARATAPSASLLSNPAYVRNM